MSDADIAAGLLLNADGSPKYPIIISLASEAIADTEIVPLRNYVAVGGFLMAGSSAFTRNPSGTTRCNFALANEMGLRMVNAGLQNWAQNTTFTKVMEHRLVSHIPVGHTPLAHAANLGGNIVGYLTRAPPSRILLCVAGAHR